MKKGIKKLGKGLSALLPDTSEPSLAVAVMSRGEEKVSQAGKPAEIPISEIHLNPLQPREYFAEDRLRDLADSIKAQGVIQPLIVRTKDSGYELIAGERRLRASQIAGLETVPVVISEITDDHVLEASLVENLQREDLNILEVAQAYKKLAEELELTHEAIGKQLGVSREQVTNTLRLLLLPPVVQEMILRGSVLMGHAKILLSLPDEEKIISLANQINAGGLSVRETDRLAKKFLTPPARSRSTAPKQRDAVVADLEDRLRKHLGTKVKIDDRNGKGQIQIEYYSHSEFSRIMEILGLGDS
ncbi:MAG: ParB/RepB/Spo0J family partition protein [Planctomycetes bacterium]|nr:ParB/RepB/Spo0J family partition protein [Planctomycetota bacterium]